MLGNICALVETTKHLRSLSLSQCNLGAKSLFSDEEEKPEFNTALLKLFDSMLRNNSSLSTIDVSGNTISPQIPKDKNRRELLEKRKETLLSIIEKVKQLIEQKPSLSSLNLSGLMLTSALTALLPALRSNTTLCYLNISNNGLLPCDQDWFLRELGILASDQPEAVLSQQIMYQSDRCFQSALGGLRSQHLKDECIAKMCKKRELASGLHDQDDVGGGAGVDGAQDVQDAAALYASMINSAIMKRVLETRHLSKKINVEADLGGQKIQKDN